MGFRVCVFWGGGGEGWLGFGVFWGVVRSGVPEWSQTYKGVPIMWDPYQGPLLSETTTILPSMGGVGAWRPRGLGLRGLGA